MSFKVNSSQQISFNDSVFSLTAREKKALDNSWAKIFADEIFPNIDEERFSVLYSSKASRPNAPVNVIIGALIIKELFDYSDDEIVENLMLDLHLQYALHTTSFEEQPISDKTLSRFRSRCYNYETTHGIDLYHDCVKDLSSKIAKLMNLSGRIKRMDSMMIESNIRFLSRMELIYTCISKLTIYFDKNYPNKIPDDLRHYTDSNDYIRLPLCKSAVQHERTVCQMNPVLLRREVLHMSRQLHNLNDVADFAGNVVHGTIFQFFKDFATKRQVVRHSTIRCEKSSVCKDNLTGSQKIFTKQSFIDTLAVKPHRHIHLKQFPVL